VIHAEWRKNGIGFASKPVLPNGRKPVLPIMHSVGPRGGLEQIVGRRRVTCHGGLGFGNIRLAHTTKVNSEMMIFLSKVVQYSDRIQWASVSFQLEEKNKSVNKTRHPVK